MGFLLNIIGVLLKPVVMLLIVVGSLSAVASLITAVIQSLVWIFSDVSGYSIAQLFNIENKVLRGSGEWFTRNPLYTIPPEVLLEKHSHLVMILFVLGGGLIGFVLSAVGFGVDAAVKRKKTAIQMGRMIKHLKSGNVAAVDRWVVFNLNRTTSVKRAVGEVAGETVYRYENENTITGNFRSVMVQIKNNIDASNNEAAIAVMQQWLKIPVLR